MSPSPKTGIRRKIFRSKPNKNIVNTTHSKVIESQKKQKKKEHKEKSYQCRTHAHTDTVSNSSCDKFRNRIDVISI